MEQSNERIVQANGVDLCVQTFGDRADAPVLLIGNSMLAWAEELCHRIAGTARFVIRYDLRDTGRSTTIDPDAPGYTLRDLVADAVALVDAFDLPRVHVVGYAVGGWIAQLAALDHPGRVRSLTLIATRPTAPGPSDVDLSDHSPALMSQVMSGREPDWSDRTAVIDAMTASGRHYAGSGEYDEDDVRAQVGRIFDRTVGAAPREADLAKRHRANQMATQFAAIDSGDRWRERLGTITAPTLVIHGEDDPFFPIGNGEALTDEIPGATLLRLPGIGQELPRRVWAEVVAGVVRHTAAS